MFGPATADQAHLAQILTGATMAAWLVCGFIPAWREHAWKIRAGILAAYLIGCAAFVAYVLVG